MQDQYAKQKVILSELKIKEDVRTTDYFYFVGKFVEYGPHIEVSDDRYTLDEYCQVYVSESALKKSHGNGLPEHHRIYRVSNFQNGDLLHNKHGQIYVSIIGAKRFLPIIHVKPSATIEAPIVAWPKASAADDSSFNSLKRRGEKEDVQPLPDNYNPTNTRTDRMGRM